MSDHQIGTRQEWQAARDALLAQEKEHTRLGDQLARQRRELPWVPVEKQYTFQTAVGQRTLPELFAGRSQLVIYHFMFGPDYSGGCPTCSSMADGFNGLVAHLAARDVTLICVSRAPLDELLAYRDRMGWSFNWASSAENDFNFDFGASHTEEATRRWVEPMVEAGAPSAATQNASATGTDLVTYFLEQPGVSVFVRDGDSVYQTYYATSRGVEFLMGYYPILDRVPKGRDEDGPYWVRRHDEYESE